MGILRGVPIVDDNQNNTLKQPEQTVGDSAPIAFYCKRRHQCKWQCFALHQGLGWGRIENTNPAWREWHQRECGGRLIPLYDSTVVENLKKELVALSRSAEQQKVAR